KYEELVLEPEKMMRALSDFLALDFQPAMLETTGFNPPSYTTKQHKLVGARPDANAITRWEKRLNARQVEIFENLTRDFMAYLDYPLRYGLGAKAPSFIELQRGKARELLRGEIANKFKWLKRSYPLWLSSDFYAQARLTDINN
ncbi:MAG: sulfotransferase, partial [Chloroflexi bacterium]|nr:sulfotransferase [Chloroflexota bacterium]